MMMNTDTNVKWIVAVDGEVWYTTDTDNRDEAEIWADENVEPDTSYEIMSTEQETKDFLYFGTGMA